jgi:hypothetical protein
MKKMILAIASTLVIVGCTSPNTTEEKALFINTYKSDTLLTPNKVATQVVAGMNYKFRCKDKQSHTYEVVIYKPLPNQGKATVTSVQECKK